MSLVWQCARCGATDPGTDDQREGRQPPSSWLNIYLPVDGTTYGRRGVLCAECKAAFASWLDPEDGERA